MSSASALELGTQLSPKFGPDGLIPCITVDHASNEVLMFAFMNAESLAQTLRTGQATYWSRSRRKLWVKGEESGHIQRVKELRVDCDQDVLLLKVENVGGAACHNGYRSCFYRRITPDGQLEFAAERVFDPALVYKK
ncbi:MAG TPA: phosphoribosyl-AMP cyclohydrolase [Opitutaceae bacterium]|jgi:phosphoribosyl-AMP cyclohydrolase|nr:phosphoribosyl-AMP cyclohydrolase [Opitutaceae bacterium]